MVDLKGTKSAVTSPPFKRMVSLNQDHYEVSLST
jgi:hypothetical protein